MATLTTLNSVITLSVNGIFPSPIRLQGYSADDVYDNEEIDTAETSMGIDGLLSAGLIFVEIPWSITLQANSASNQVFDTWYQQQIANQDVSSGTMNIQLPGLGYKWVYSNGFLKKMNVAPSAKKIAQPRKFTIVWNSVAVQPL